MIRIQVVRKVNHRALRGRVLDEVQDSAGDEAVAVVPTTYGDGPSFLYDQVVTAGVKLGHQQVIRF